MPTVCGRCAATGTPVPELPDLRVLLVLASSTGGVGRHVASLTARLGDRGIAVEVAGPAATEELFGFRRAGAVFHAVEIAARPRPVRDVRAVWSLRRLLRTAPEDGPGPPDLVHAHGLRAGLLAGLARPAGPPLVVTLHNAVAGTGLRRLLVGSVERLAIRRADVVLAASADLASRAADRGARDVRSVPVVAPPRPPVQRSPAEVRAKLGALERPLLLAVGRLHPQKGFDVLIDAATMLAGAALASRCPPPLVVIAGDGPAEPALRAQIAAAHAPVRLLGRRTDVEDLLAAADVVVLPSRWEARALIAQEALRAGRPLVATAVGGLPELLGDGAALVAAEDPAALAAAVAGLLDDPAAAASLGERGRQRSAGWPDEAAMLEQLTTVYADVSGRTGQTREP
jgi:glycosyltransferase involved in cell wall biosynthesis